MRLWHDQITPGKSTLTPRTAVMMALSVGAIIFVTHSYIFAARDSTDSLERLLPVVEQSDLEARMSEFNSTSSIRGRGVAHDFAASKSKLGRSGWRQSELTGAAAPSDAASPADGAQALVERDHERSVKSLEKPSHIKRKFAGISGTHRDVQRPAKNSGWNRKRWNDFSYYGWRGFEYGRADLWRDRRYGFQ